jgi:hypothetical protein
MIAPRDTTFIAFGNAQAMVDAIWMDFGLKYPPAVEPLPRQSSATIARASRLSICLPARTPSWCLLHELAHAMTSDVDGSSDGHGPIFMGVYLKLISRYLRIAQDFLLDSAIIDKIEVVPDASPSFVDAERPDEHKNLRNLSGQNQKSL